MQITHTTMSYASRLDGLAPLYADAIFVPDGRPKPLVAVLHGFHCTRQHVTADCMALAERGLFCVAPDMRGHGDSAGRHDCGGLQICDIVDALCEAALAFPSEIDRRNVNAVGYSGGGGNVLSLCTKFPELLHGGASFFGMSDYALWHQTRGREDCNKTMEAALGGSPEEVPERYAARSSLRAVQNNPHTRLRLFWDTEEKDCPPILNERFLEEAQRLGYTNVHAEISRPGDPYRWHHGYRTTFPELAAGDPIFSADFLQPPMPYVLPEQGELMVCGYVVTTRFAVWLGTDGLSGWARVRYDLGDSEPGVDVLEASSDAALRVISGPTLLDWYIT